MESLRFYRYYRQCGFCIAVCLWNHKKTTAIKRTSTIMCCGGNRYFNTRCILQCIICIARLFLPCRSLVVIVFTTIIYIHKSYAVESNRFISSCFRLTYFELNCCTSMVEREADTSTGITISYLLNLHPQPCEHISSIPCGTTPTHLFWLHKIIYLEYTFHFGLKTPICIQAKLSFVFKPNRILYSSQIECCIQAKLKRVFTLKCLMLYGNASKR